MAQAAQRAAEAVGLRLAGEGKQQRELCRLVGLLVPRPDARGRAAAGLDLVVCLFTRIADQTTGDETKLRAAEIGRLLDQLAADLAGQSDGAGLPAVHDELGRAWAAGMEQCGCDQAGGLVQALPAYLRAACAQLGAYQQERWQFDSPEPAGTVMCAAVCAVTEACATALEVIAPPEAPAGRLVKEVSVPLPEATGAGPAEGRIWVFDDLVGSEEAESMHEIASRASYRRVEYSVHPEYKHSVLDHPVDQFLSSVAGRAMKRLAEACFGRPGLYCYRSYTNAVLSSDVSFLHRDIDLASDGVNATVLMYPVEERWEASWGGETCFFDSEGEIVLSVLPKRGRAVVFDSRVMHVGRVPSSLFRGYRFSLALKLSEIE